MAVRETLFRFLAAALLPALAGCAGGLQARVSRFQSMPSPMGQSFAVQAADPADAGGLEFGRYAELVSRRLESLGYAQAPSSGAATLLVSLDYGFGAAPRTTFVDVDVRRAADGQAVFEGTAKSRSEDGELNELVPRLIEAVFTDFPGKDGETVKVVVPGRAPPR